MGTRADGAEPEGFEAGQLARLLADDRRRRLVAAVVLGARTSDEARARSGLTAREFATALARLVDGGLLVIGDDERLSVIESAFRSAARGSRPSVAEIDEPSKVIRAFVIGGRLRSIPAAQGKRRVVLERLAEEFEPGRRYSEKAVNLILGQWHADVAALRRYLVDEGFLDREAGQYWRCGGAVAT